MKEKVEKRENALFFQRLVAFIIDIMIVSMVASLLSYPFYDAESVTKLSNNTTELTEKYMNQEIDMETYMTESVDISYEMARKNGIVSLVTIFLSILYFVCYQVRNDGQTIGKKLMRIQIVKDDESDLTVNNMIFRSLIINSILADMIIIAFIIFANKNVYFYGVGTIEMIQYTVIFVSALMVMFSKTGRGLHDLVAHTKVVRSDSVKELEVCEN